MPGKDPERARSRPAAHRHHSHPLEPPHVQTDSHALQLTDTADALPPHMLEEVPEGAELVDVVEPAAELVDVAPAAASVALPPPPEPAAPAAAEQPSAAPQPAPAKGRPVKPGAVNGPKRLREKLRKSTAEDVAAALAYGRAAGVEDLAGEAEKIYRERCKVARRQADWDAAEAWREAVRVALAVPAVEEPARSQPESQVEDSERDTGETEDLDELPEGEEDASETPSYMGAHPEAVAAWAETLAPLVDRLAEMTRGRTFDLTRDVDVTVMRGSPYERRVTGDLKGRLTTLASVVAAERFTLGAGPGDGAEDEAPSALWELLAIGTTLTLAALPSPAETLSKAARVFFRGATGAARLAGGLLRRGSRS